jgi:RHS repeat-associated protein
MQEYDWAGRLSAQTLVGGDLWGEPRLLEQRQLRRTGGDLVTIRERIGGGREYSTEITGRIVEVRGASGTEGYGYDALGNVVRAAGSAAAPGPRSFAGTLIAEAGGYSYRHDGNGRLTARGSAATGQWLHEWDAAGRMTGVVCPDGSRWRYRYDPLGRRIAKERLAADGTPAERIEFSWLGFRLAEQVHTTADGSRSVTTWLYHPLTGHLAAQVTDELGTPTELIDPDGELAWRRDAPLWGADGSTELLLRFPGQYYDAETGVHYNVHRYYDPVTARYASPDPLGLMPAPNPVAYVPNPLAAADPLGLWRCTEYDGVLPRDDYVVGVYPQPRQPSQRFEHVMPMAAVRGSGVPSPGAWHEIAGHRGAAGGGISSTGRGAVAPGWPGDLAAMLRNGDCHGAYANAILGQLNASIHSAGALCHYLDHVRDMTLPAGAAARLTHAEVTNLALSAADVDDLRP